MIGWKTVKYQIREASAPPDRPFACRRKATPAVTLLSVPALVAVALALTPLFVKVLGRHAGWPIVAFFVAAIVQLARLSGGVLDGDAVTWRAM